MRTVSRLLMLPVAFLSIIANSAAAGQQPHVVSPQQLSDAITTQVASQDAKRAAVRESLTRPEVRRVAVDLGIDVERLAFAVDAMTATDLDQAASAAGQVNQHLVGGDSSVTLSTTTIIIALLVLILIIVAVH